MYNIDEQNNRQYSEEKPSRVNKEVWSNGNKKYLNVSTGLRLPSIALKKDGTNEGNWAIDYLELFKGLEPSHDKVTSWSQAPLNESIDSDFPRDYS